MGWCVVLIWWSGFERILHSGFVGMRVSNGATDDSMSVQNSVEVRGEMEYVCMVSKNGQSPLDCSNGAHSIGGILSFLEKFYVVDETSLQDSTLCVGGKLANPV